jgi:hypothetical protein
MTTNTNTYARRIARYIALPIMSAGIIGAGALGMAGMANAATSTAPSGPGYSYAPAVKAPVAAAGQTHHHSGVTHVEKIVPGYTR